MCYFHEILRNVLFSRNFANFAIFTKFDPALEIWQNLFAQKSFISWEKTSHVAIQRTSVNKSILRSFAKFTGKHLCQGLFFNKVAGLWLYKKHIAILFLWKFLLAKMCTIKCKVSAIEPLSETLGSAQNL